ncbi:hypothetical protein [Mesorhizobium sp. M0968]|uniref:hypothetical protein n=1 Tax=Mesorhizobium sp. M0968 TaxID=2957037 RepID=UPI00333D8E04
MIAKLSDTSFGEEAHHVAKAMQQVAAEQGIAVGDLVATLARKENPDDLRYRMAIEQGDALFGPAGWSRVLDNDLIMKWTDEGGRTVVLRADGRLTASDGTRVTDTFDTASAVFAALDSMAAAGEPTK